MSITVKNSSLLTVIVPVFNEETSLPGFLEKLISCCREKNWRLVLVDDSSTDESPRILEKIKADPLIHVIHHKINRGYGGAIKSGIQIADTPYVVTIDADGQHSVKDIVTLFDVYLDTNADMLVGKRSIKSTTKVRRIGKWLIRTFARLIMNFPVTDLNSGFKIYRTDLARQYIRLCPDSMAYSDIITLLFINQKNLVIEYPITIEARQGGKSTIGLSTAFDTVSEILNISILFNPGRVFYPISIFCVLFGILWGIPFIAMGKGVSVGAMLAIITGLLIFGIGLIAQQLSSIQKSTIEYSYKEITKKDQG